LRYTLQRLARRARYSGMSTDPSDDAVSARDEAPAAAAGRKRARRRLAAAPDAAARPGERTLGKLIAETALLADGVIQQRQRDREAVHPRRRGGLFGFLR
jgi:hypothetical protein